MTNASRPVEADLQFKLARTAVRAAIDQKALDVKGLDVAEICSFADCFVIASGTSERHVQGIADKVRKALLDLGERPMSVTGKDAGEWIIIDYGGLVVHVFYEPTRQYYEFDEFWKAARPVPIDPDLAQEMRRLRTGSFG